MGLFIEWLLWAYSKWMKFGEVVSASELFGCCCISAAMVSDGLQVFIFNIPWQLPINPSALALHSLFPTPPGSSHLPACWKGEGEREKQRERKECKRRKGNKGRERMERGKEVRNRERGRRKEQFQCLLQASHRKLNGEADRKLQAAPTCNTYNEWT